ncbi:MAG: hypothetical protein KA419_12535 [Acidobacteria bacterium]|nr:hypothetical protein [Acidobacteriota bacterium]
MRNAPVEVLTYSGCRADERPEAVVLDGRRRAVTAVLARWREPDGECFEVRLDDGSERLLRHREPEDRWETELQSPVLPPGKAPRMNTDLARGPTGGRFPRR